MTGGWYHNPAARTWRCAGVPDGVAAFHAGLPGYAPSRLVEMPGLAAELGVGRVFVKDESARFGLPAFKVLGASWAVVRALSARLGDDAPAGLDALRSRLAADPPRLVAATDGNHGRAVARMARLLGLPAAVFVPSGLTDAAVTAVADEGATVETVAGSYDDAVAAAASAADEPGSVLVQDSAWPGYEQVPGWIAEGYATLFTEVDDQLAAAGAPPAALVAVPVGVGSLAQAAVAHYRAEPAAPPALLAVEPMAAACVLASLNRGELTTVSTEPTPMAGLNCGTPSSLAWPYLRGGVDAAVAVTDDAAVRAVHDLTAGGVAAGPCGGAALAGARAATAGDRQAMLGLTPASVVVLVSTEGIAANPLPDG